MSLFSKSVSLFLFCNEFVSFFKNYIYVIYDICLCFTSVSIIISRYICVAATGLISFFFNARVIFHSIYVPHLLQMNIEVHICFQSMVFFRYMPRHGIPESYGSTTFRFLRNLHTVLCMIYQFIFPPTNVGEFPFFHIFSSIYCL